MSQLSSDSSNEFYIGWQERAPARTSALMKKVVALLLVFVGLMAYLGSTSFQRLPAASFEFGNARNFIGVISSQPVPLLRVERPGIPGQGLGEFPISSEYTLVAFGKFGADELIRPFAGERVLLEGTLIYRDGQTLIEVAEGSLEKAMPGRPLPAPAAERLGEFTLQGTIVDSKCFFGVMNPGFSKSHRACAVRCISGGIPPVFWVRDGKGNARYLLLLSPAGQPVNHEVLDFVAEPLEIQGEVVRYGDLLALLADPESYRRLE